MTNFGQKFQIFPRRGKYTLTHAVSAYTKFAFCKQKANFSDNNNILHNISHHDYIICLNTEAGDPLYKFPVRAAPHQPPPTPLHVLTYAFTTFLHL